MTVAPDKPFHVAVVGAGNIGRNHARCYRDHPLSQVAAFTDVLRGKAEQAAKEFGGKAFGSVKELLSSGVRVDAASVCTAGRENGGDHYEPTMELLKAGIPVLGEKPISNEIPKAREMVSLARDKKVPYAVNLNHRFTPAARKAKEWQEAGRLGELNSVFMRLWINNPNESAPHFHMRALHPHSLDIMRYFAGDIAKVHAFFKRGKGRQGWSNVHVNLLFKSGVLGHLHGSYDAGGTYGLETLDLAGSEGRVVIEEACEKLWFYPRNGPQVERYDCLGGMRNFGETFAFRIDAWLQDLHRKTPPEKIDGKAEDALKVQLVIEAAIESWEKGSVVEVPAA